MCNEDGTVWVAFNGEIYNYRELRQELTSQGHVFRSQSDTEVILHAYENYGDACVGRLWGMFAFALWDQRQKRVLVARDRFGEKPLVYAELPGGLAAASTIPALLQVLPLARKASRQALAKYFVLGYVPSPAAAIAGIHKLAPGCAFSWQDGTFRQWRYYPGDEGPAFRGSFRDAVVEFRYLFEDAVARRLVADVPLALALSGGLDSAAVAVAASRAGTGRLAAVTVSSDDAASSADEAPAAATTAGVLRLSHRTVKTRPEMWRAFDIAVAQLGEPFAIASVAPTYHLFAAFRGHATVVLTGDGGDELLAGYPNYQFARWRARLVTLNKWSLLQRSYATLDRLYSWLPSLRRILKPAMAGIQFVSGEPIRDASWEYRRVLRIAPVVSAEDTLRAPQHLAADPLRLALWNDRHTTLPDHMLTKVDLASMSHAIEARSPFLDHRLVAFVDSLPTSFLLLGQQSKRLLRAYLRGALPDEVLRRPKTGFGFPLREYFAGPLRSAVLEVLMSPDPIYDALVERQRIPEVLGAHVNGMPHLTTLLLTLLSLRLWLGSFGITDLVD
jgi:asparagine synthase (glutamine-hydrolysing)